MGITVFHLGTFASEGRSVPCLVIGNELFDLRLVSGRAGIKLPSFDILADLLEDWDRNFDRLQELANHAIIAEGGTPLQGARPLPPLGRPRKMLFMAANYRDHASGMRKTFTPKVEPQNPPVMPAPLRPYLFAKVCEPTGACDDILLPAATERIDWEAEMMVVIGRSGRSIRGSAAGDHIAGYMTTNDISCRDRTWRDDRPALRSDWLSGKSFDSFAPIGPFFTPAAFVPDHNDMRVRLWINGVIKQDGNTRDMIFSVEEQIEYASELMTLLPGDLIATGTPAGTGQERLEFLKPGDLIETEVEFCGRQRNRVTSAVAADGIVTAAESHAHAS